MPSVIAAACAGRDLQEHPTRELELDTPWQHPAVLAAGVVLVLAIGFLIGVLLR